MSNTNTMMRVRTSTKSRLRAIAQRNRWPLVEAIQAAVEQLEKSEEASLSKPKPASKRTPVSA